MTPPRTVRQVFLNTDWKLLSEQKQALSELGATQPEYTGWQIKGLLQWIDELQRAAKRSGHPVLDLDEAGTSQ